MKEDVQLLYFNTRLVGKRLEEKVVDNTMMMLHKKMQKSRDFRTSTCTGSERHENPFKVPYVYIEAISTESACCEEDLDTVFLKHSTMVKNGINTCVSNFGTAKQILEALHGEANLVLKEEILSFAAVIPLDRPHEVTTQQNYMSGIKALVISSQIAWRERMRIIIEKSDGTAVVSDTVDSLKMSMYFQHHLHKFDAIIIDGSEENKTNLQGLVKTLNEQAEGYSLGKSLPVIIADSNKDILENILQGVIVGNPNVFIIPNTATMEKINTAVNKAFAWLIKKKFVEEFQNNAETVLVLAKDIRIREIVEQIASRYFCETAKCECIEQVKQKVNEEQSQIHTIVVSEKFVEEIDKIMDAAKNKTVKVVILEGNGLDRRMERKLPTVVSDIVGLFRYFSEIFK